MPLPDLSSLPGNSRPGRPGGGGGGPTVQQIANKYSFEFDNTSSTYMVINNFTEDFVNEANTNNPNSTSKDKKIIVNKKTNQDEIFKIVENFSKNSVSFHEFIEDINKNYSKVEKHELIRFLWKVAYADLILEVNEEKLIRRIGDLIHIKDMEVLRIKNEIKEINT